MRLLCSGLVLGVILTITACNLQSEQVVEQQQIAQADTPTPSETIPAGDPLPTVTPRSTLRPPPTFEPPTLTPAPSATPTITPTPTIQIEGDLPPLLGLDTPTLPPGEEEPCQIREDWQLLYEVQPGDAMAKIADIYNIFVDELAEGNCIDDPSIIRVGQFIRVPGDAHPLTPQFVCEPWELLTPFNGTVTVPAEGTITFNWRGPESPRYLVRLYRNDTGTGDIFREYLTEFQEYYILDLTDIPEGGLYSWRVFPIGMDFLQIPCQESHHSIFVKDELPPTPTIAVPN